jgi:hypothetical protein
MEEGADELHRHPLAERQVPDGLRDELTEVEELDELLPCRRERGSPAPDRAGGHICEPDSDWFSDTPARGGSVNETERATLIDRYRTGTSDAEAALAWITDEELDRQPADPDDWTARKIAHHLADSEAMAYIRLRRLIAEEDPLIAGYDEPEWARRLHYDRPIAASIAVLGAVRSASLELLASLTDAEWNRSGTHSDSGPYAVDDWLRIYAAHPHDHADQIRRVRGG